MKTQSLYLHELEQATLDFVEGRIDDAGHTEAVRAILIRLNLRQQALVWLWSTWLRFRRQDNLMLAYYQRRWW